MLYLKNLKKFYNKGQIKAVDIKSLFIEKGRIACLIGPSGCGKTSTLKMINRLIKPNEGFIKINGRQSEEQNPLTWRRRIGYVIQKNGLLPHLNIEDNISLLSRVLKKEKKAVLQRVAKLLTLVGLEPSKYQKRYPIELSGGEEQRVGIARALMEDPPLLLMDEPFGALDSLTRSSLKKELIRLNHKLKKTILMVTHDLHEAFFMGDQLILMNKGSIAQEGSGEELLKNPANSFVENFLSEMNDRDEPIHRV